MKNQEGYYEHNDFVFGECPECHSRKISEITTTEYTREFNKSTGSLIRIIDNGKNGCSLGIYNKCRECGAASEYEGM